MSNSTARSIAKRQEKAQKGVFFISLALTCTAIVLGMLFVLTGLMLYRGSARLLFSPTYFIRFVDGTTLQTEINQNIEFEVKDEDGVTATRSALQTGKYFLNQKAETLKYSDAPIPAGTTVEVWKDEVVEVADPWASEGEEAAKIKQTNQVRQESISNAKEVVYDSEKKTHVVTLSDDSQRIFGADVNLQYRQGDKLLNRKTLVTYYLQNHPDEARSREEEIQKSLREYTGTGYVVDPRWAAHLTGHQKVTAPNGSTFYSEVRIKPLPAIASFEVVDKWNWFQFFWDWPRASNTEGGVLPCIFGTVMMTLLMTVIVAPFGVATAVYLMEYARDTWTTRMIRIAVANLAGVPSIVFGLFGLGFFVMTVGGNIDRVANNGELWLGTPCVLWASLTMALLTLPVMIVASEEALRTVPRELREGALALGATKFSSIMTVVIPTAMPGILTGVILAVARGAGEVAPLLLTGVVAQKDQLPLSFTEKFQNLAYHIYDLSVKSPPNKIEEAQSLAFSSALILVLVVLVMNIFAILLRARLSRVKLQ